MLKIIILKAIKTYKKLISPLLAPRCKFYPTCSEYFYQSVEKKGVIIGSWKGIKRIFRCNPWNKGGVDLP